MNIWTQALLSHWHNLFTSPSQTSTFQHQYHISVGSIQPHSTCCNEAYSFTCVCYCLQLFRRLGEVRHHGQHMVIQGVRWTVTILQCPPLYVISIPSFNTFLFPVFTDMETFCPAQVLLYSLHVISCPCEEWVECVGSSPWFHWSSTDIL